ncbi:VOC family protein [Georgenia faecalis]|uniref:VOC family protein n=1 Tax=Georgenia faecalis TaxID=2483799 RepID=UPI000FDACEA1|nr:VOC family protein [Georgenia faecalis]
MNTHYRPEGYTTISPFVAVSPAREAIDFYGAVFGARVVTRADGPDGAVMHCELDLGDGRMTLADPDPEYHATANDPTRDDATFSLGIYVPDVDAVTERARERGARVREEPMDFEVTGDRFASIQDPFGVRWTIMCRVTPHTDAEVQAGLEAWTAPTTEAATS